jgi:hypothetical protein
MQSPAVDDADASMALALDVDELFHARDGFRGCLAVQVERAACGVVSAFEFSQFSPIDTRGGVALIRSGPIVIARCRSWER